MSCADSSVRMIATWIEIVRSTLKGREMKRTYETWRYLVNGWCEKKYGISTDDMPDMPYHLWYENHISPLTAATKAYRLAF